MELQLSAPELIREKVKAYREERRRVEGDARRMRSILDRDYAKARAEIQRIVSSVAKGLVTRLSLVRSGLEVAVVGSISAGVGYAIGHLVTTLAG